MFVPRNCLKQLKCSTCNSYLSCFPIHLCDDQKVVCGRCCPQQPETGIRMAPYEFLAQFLEFPCIHSDEGCPEQLLPADVQEHEKNCCYKTISCPSQQTIQCPWRGTCNDLLEHCEEVHPILVLTRGEFELDLVSSNEQKNILVYRDDLFLFKREFNSETNNFWCWVISFEHTKVYNYQIRLSNGNRSLSVEFPPLLTSVVGKENGTAISIKTVRDQLQDPAIVIGTINIFRETVVEKSKLDSVNLEMLSELECPICFEYMTSPIFLCEKGHSICCECKVLVAECPLCNTPINDSQNFMLEKISSLMIIPCKFSDFGCNFSSQPGRVKEHQKFCEKGPHPCPLKDYENCNWKSNAADVARHVQTEHHENFLDLDTITVFVDDNYFQDEDRCGYLLRFAGRMFKLHFLYKEEIFYWNMQLIGPAEECVNFRYDIDVVDNNHNGQKIYFRSVCSSFSDKDNSFLAGVKFVFVKLDQIRSFIADNQLTYRVHLRK